MTTDEKYAMVTVALLAAEADGRLDDREKAEMDRIRQELASDGEDFSGAFQDVATKRVTVEETVSRITSDEGRRMAYALAYRICSADGDLSANEERFLTQLQSALRLDAADAKAERERWACGESSRDKGAESGGHGTAVPDGQEMETLIRRYATITASMEILPDGFASLGILPLQLRLMYLVGKQHGFELDSRQLLEFAATFGIGLAVQTLEAAIRKMTGLGGVFGIAAAAAATFGATYALGKVANLYYGGGRKLDLGLLRKKFGEYRDQAKGVYETCKDEVVKLGRSGNPAAAAGA